MVHSLEVLHLFLSLRNRLGCGFMAVQIVGEDGGGNESDDDLITTSTVISLRDPLSGSRIVTPARCVPAPLLQGPRKATTCRLNVSGTRIAPFF